MSYDIDRLHTEVKDELIRMGYMIRWNYPGHQSYELPNTTVWHSNKSSNQAIVDLSTVCNILRVKIEKAVAVIATEFVGV